MKKLLFFYPERKLTPTGGPSGYLWNLRQGLDTIAQSDIAYSFLQNVELDFEEHESLRKMIPNRIKDFRRALKFANYVNRKRSCNAEYLDYDILHFHSTEDMWLNRELLDKYSGKVVLTSHTPCASFYENISRLKKRDYLLLKNKIDRMKQIDEYGFKRADYVIFPCEEAEEPYYNTWNEYNEIKNARKYRYVPTGIVGCEAKVTKSEVRAKYNIPEDAFVVSYVGRHNKIKGYADLKEIGTKLLENKNIYFLIAGREEPMKGLSNDHWIEIGWTNDPHSLIAASDVFVLPNHETYFDLVLLEVLSLGVPVVMSETGGNKYFSKFHTDGLKLYKDLEKAIVEINNFHVMNHNDKQRVNQEILEIFKNNFTIDKFARNYLSLIREFVGEV